MQNLVNSYNENAGLIEPFIISSLKQLDRNMDVEVLSQRLYGAFPSLELVYMADPQYIQSSKNIYRDRMDESGAGQSREYLVTDSGSEIFFHKPYISTATGHLCITVVRKMDAGYLFLDFSVRSLLERFDLIQTQSGVNFLHKLAYAFIGGGLLFFGLFLVGYGFYDFVSYFIYDHGLSLETVFKPIIALTLGLAVYDLGKTILDEEVLPHTQHKSEGFNAKTLLKFSVSIIIALLIESLLVVFKISLVEYKDLPYAAMLIGAVALLILVFAIFIYLNQKGHDKVSDLS